MAVKKTNVKKIETLIHDEAKRKNIPTAEQDNTLNTKGRIVKINARAGTGKTATLLMIAQQNPDKKIIYLVFNSRNRQEARNKFPSNVAIHIIHSFTRAIVGRHFREHLIIRPSLFLDHFVLKKKFWQL